LFNKKPALDGLAKSGEQKEEKRRGLAESGKDSFKQ